MHRWANASAEWNIYGFLWTNDKMRWLINGKEIHTKVKGIQVPNESWPDQNMCIIINNGLLNVVEEGNTTFPNALILDYLAIYNQD